MPASHASDSLSEVVMNYRENFVFTTEISWTKSRAAHAVEMTALFHMFPSVDQI
jgi:hypothetical protein